MNSKPPKGNRMLARSIESAASAMSGQASKQAVIYLRVSSDQQVNTDIDRDGFSLPAQRSACTKKARSLGAAVVDEFVERGESGRSTEKRTELAAMLDRVARGDIDFVIVHKVDRLARRRADDAVILDKIRAAGARLVSVSENIDETPSGMLLHGIMASIAEFYSMNLSAEVLKGTTEKARKGGTPTLVPIGYQNVTERIDGRDIKTVAVDAERGHLIAEAFELYASGNLSLIDLAAVMEARGLRSRGTRKSPPIALGGNRLCDVLRNPYYTGKVKYNGKLYEGRHTALVEQSTFERVQEVLDAHRLSGERSYKHHHHLRGTLVCGRCGETMVYSRHNGNGGRYEYFVCMGRKRNSGCRLPHQRKEAIEAAVERLYEVIELSDAARATIADGLRRYLEVRQTEKEPQLAAAHTKLMELRAQERKLLDAHYADEISRELFSEEQQRIRRERIAAEVVHEQMNADFAEIAKTVEEAIDMTDRIQRAYLLGGDGAKRLFNQAIFESIAVDQEEISSAVLSEPFAILLGEDEIVVRARGGVEPRPRKKAARPEKSDFKKQTTDLLSKVGGLNFQRLVELAGLEPATSCMPCRRSPN